MLVLASPEACGLQVRRVVTLGEFTGPCQSGQAALPGATRRQLRRSSALGPNRIRVTCGMLPSYAQKDEGTSLTPLAEERELPMEQVGFGQFRLGGGTDAVEVATSLRHCPARIGLGGRQSRADKKIDEVKATLYLLGGREYGRDLICKHLERLLGRRSDIGAEQDR